jgi:NADH-quinone oxidoreductase subunit F
MLRKSPISYLVVNGDESEPATFKDHFLVERDPHQLVEGVIIAAYALQVSQVFIFFAESSPWDSSASSRRSTTPTPKAHWDQRSSDRTSLSTSWCTRAPGAYICGEETALIEALEGKRGFPRIKPPFFPAVTGLYGEPTVVNNVETMSNLPWIINNGGAAFAALGAGRSTGTRLFALAGRVNNPWRLRDRDGEEHVPRPDLRPATRWRHSSTTDAIKAIIPGGVSAPWFGPEMLDLPLGQDEVGEKGSMLGSGSVVVLTTRVVSCAPRGASPSSSHASRAVSARRVAKVRAGSSARCTASSTAAVAWKTLTYCSTCATTSPRDSRGRPSRRPFACSVRPFHRQCTRRFQCFATTSLRT